MKVLSEILTQSSYILSTIVIFITFYYLILSLFGIYKSKKKKVYDPKKRFALLVAAHNEEAVVSDIITSLNCLNYPKEFFDTFVIADNCTDKTAAVARKDGALVYERFSKDKRGKGYALEWMFKKIFKMEKKYDAIVIFDADNVIHKEFLNEMNNKLCDGYNVVQGYLDSKNPKDTWITGSYSIAFWSTNRMFQLSRSNLGLSCQLGGTGFAISTDILRKLGWGATCLTEDLEFSCKLVLNGEKVGWAHDAIIYDEKPLTLMQSWKQRKRWMQGFADVSSRYFFKLLKKAIKERSFVAFDCAMYSVQPIVTILLGISLLIGFRSNSGLMFNLITGKTEINLSIIFFLFLAIFQFIYTPFILILEKKFNFKIILYYIVYPIYALTWFPISIQGVIGKNKREWSHTAHTRSISISELDKAN